MSIHQEHFGRKFYQDKKIGYWISTDYPRIRAHQWVWISIHKVIPKGYHIHHRNDDKSDNRIENLELIHGSRHHSLHMQDPKRKEMSRLMADKYRHLTKDWHKSEEGIIWHRLHAIKSGFGNNEPREFECDQCKNKFLSKKIGTNGGRFCSNACKSKSRRDSGVDNILKLCKRCGKEFMNSKYSKQKYCGKRCIVI